MILPNSISLSAYPGNGAVLLFTGLPGAGKSTLSQQLHAQLTAQGHAAAILDGDVLRRGLCADLGFSEADRSENVRRAGEVARLMAEGGLLVLLALIAPLARQRAMLRERVGAPFLEIWCAAPLAACEARDPKGLYARARAGALPGLTGIDAPYEAPRQPDLMLDTDRLTPQHCLQQVTALLEARLPHLTRRG
ncbi:adenylyl-sulfate kinase [Chitiniphilus eburneus]|uniref:Adenylyl-sulfate kinase n=1 Tax=Chitiniphilus eburneus TaxID=2571148 RepID=A0A4U0QCA7_9NEIS|nr:adenylyl-sulfate kinase [Chitiniphilus eburneus]TJZ78926.1 adenylyl-sulfate kinase [Chitiniphilus eburneus]